MLFYISIRSFFLILCFPVYNNAYPKYCQSYKNTFVNEIRGFIFENYSKQIGISEENSYYSMKRLKKNIYCCFQTN